MQTVKLIGQALEGQIFVGKGVKISLIVWALSGFSSSVAFSLL